MLGGIETGRDDRLLLRPGMARLKGLETLRVVSESRLELKEVITLRCGFLGEDIAGLFRAECLRDYSRQLDDGGVHCIPRSLPRQRRSVTST